MKDCWTSDNKLCFICSPYSGEVKKNVRFAVEYCTYAVVTNLNPIAPHLLYPQFLSDKIDEQREHGLRLALELLARCDLMWVCGEHISEGMKGEIAEAERLGIPIEYVSEPPLDYDGRKLVYISAPNADTETISKYCAFAVAQGDNPIAPSLHYPHFMDNFSVDDREGMLYAHDLLVKCDELWVFGERLRSYETACAEYKDVPVRFISDEEVADFLNDKS